MGQLCYTLGMRVCFVAVISRWGLESLILECEGVHSRVKESVDERRVTCFWTVLQPAEAAAIRDLIEDGESQQALQTLEQSAEFKGPILPFSRQYCQEATP